jgi:hypothetical protein
MFDVECSMLNAVPPQLVRDIGRRLLLSLANKLHPELGS